MDYEPDANLMPALEKGNCPDCGYRGFVIGPMAGPTPMHINIECGGCRKRFNAVFYSGRVVTAHRIESVAEGGLRWVSEPANGGTAS